MTREDTLAFARRDWATVTDAKARFWAARKPRMSAVEALMTADMLRLHVRQLRPAWPEPDERAADLAHHVSLAGALRAVPTPRSR